MHQGPSLAVSFPYTVLAVSIRFVFVQVVDLFVLSGGSTCSRMFSHKRHASAFTFGLNELSSPEAVPSSQRRGSCVPVGSLLICSSLWRQGDNIIGKRLTK